MSHILPTQVRLNLTVLWSIASSQILNHRGIWIETKRCDERFEQVRDIEWVEWDQVKRSDQMNQETRVWEFKQVRLDVTQRNLVRVISWETIGWIGEQAYELGKKVTRHFDSKRSTDWLTHISIMLEIRRVFGIERSIWKSEE